MAERRTDSQDGYVLHSWPYRETSLMVEIFARATGRLTLIARGARRPRSVMRGVLMAFQPLSLSWYGKGEVRTLTKAEWGGGQPLLKGEALLCGFYLNELMMKLLPREDGHEALFERYAEALRRLAEAEPSAPILRSFEKALLAELGYAMLLDRDAGSGEEIEPDGRYTYDPERGPVKLNGSAGLLQIEGRTLIALARDDYADAATLAQAKMLMRWIINHRLDFQPLSSRRIFKELLEL